MTNSVYNVVDFGADPTGVSESLVQIQRAIDAAAASELYAIPPIPPTPPPPLPNPPVHGGIVYFPCGDYLIKDSNSLIQYLSVPSHVVLMGDGAGSTLVSPQGTYIEPGNGVVTVNDPFLQNPASYGLMNDVKILNLRITNHGENSLVAVFATNNVVIENCFFEQQTSLENTSCVTFMHLQDQGGTRFPCSNVIVRSNFAKPSRKFILTQSSFTEDGAMYNFVILDNHIDGVNTFDQASWGSIKIDVNTHYFVVGNNQIDGKGLVMDGINIQEGITYGIVSDNMISDCSRVGLRIESGQSTIDRRFQNIIATNNVINNVSIDPSRAVHEDPSDPTSPLRSIDPRGITIKGGPLTEGSLDEIFEGVIIAHNNVSNISGIGCDRVTSAYYRNFIFHSNAFHNCTGGGMQSLTDDGCIIAANSISGCLEGALSISTMGRVLPDPDDFIYPTKDILVIDNQFNNISRGSFFNKGVGLVFLQGQNEIPMDCISVLNNVFYAIEDECVFAHNQNVLIKNLCLFGNLVPQSPGMTALRTVVLGSANNMVCGNSIGAVTDDHALSFWSPYSTFYTDNQSLVTKNYFLNDFNKHNVEQQSIGDTRILNNRNYITEFSSIDTVVLSGSNVWVNFTFDIADLPAVRDIEQFVVSFGHPYGASSPSSWTFGSLILTSLDLVNDELNGKFRIFQSGTPVSPELNLILRYRR